MKIDRLTREKIDKIAMQFLQKYDKKLLEEARPIPVEKIVTEYLAAKDGLQFKIDNLKYDIFQRKIWGRTNLREKIISIDTSLIETPSLKTKYRFTLAHEVGHWVLHRKYIKSQKNFYKTDDIEELIITLKECIEAFLHEFRCLYDDSRKGIEFQANSFAASLLMPSNLFEIHFYKETNAYGIKLKELLWENEYEKVYDSILRYLSSLFDVSKQAAKIRVRTLQLIEKDIERTHSGFSSVGDVLKDLIK
ncbi:MAG: hypothetical protein AB1414_15935 [bacterium]